MMTIIDETTANVAMVEDLKPGDMFVFDGVLHIKLASRCEALNVKHGVVHYFVATEVRPIKRARLHILEYGHE